MLTSNALDTTRQREQHFNLRLWLQAEVPKCADLRPVHRPRRPRPALVHGLASGDARFRIRDVLPVAPQPVLAASALCKGARVEPL